VRQAGEHSTDIENSLLREKRWLPARSFRLLDTNTRKACTRDEIGRVSVLVLHRSRTFMPGATRTCRAKERTLRAGSRGKSVPFAHERQREREPRLQSSCVGICWSAIVHVRKMAPIFDWVRSDLTVSRCSLWKGPPAAEKDASVLSELPPHQNPKPLASKLHATVVICSTPAHYRSQWICLAVYASSKNATSSSIMLQKRPVIFSCNSRSASRPTRSVSSRSHPTKFWNSGMA